MKYFFDTEFHEYQRGGIDTIELISIGIVAEDGREFYRICDEFDVGAAFFNHWLKENVLKSIFQEIKFDEKAEFTFQNLNLSLYQKGFTKKQIALDVLQFVGDDKNPQFYAYYADYDWVVFCWLFGRMIDLPEHFPRYCRDLKQMLDAFGYTNKWVNVNAPRPKNLHNALADARWNHQLFDAMADPLKTKL